MKIKPNCGGQPYIMHTSYMQCTLYMNENKILIEREMLSFL
jgi:hypothetical protein